MPPEPERLEIKWEEHPKQIPRRSRAWKWERLLAPVRATPGCEARVRTHAKQITANAEVRRIKRRMQDKDPLGRWVYGVYQIQTTEDVWGVFVTYMGQMSQREYQEELIAREQRATVARLRHQKRRERERILGATSIHEITRPSPSRRTG